MRIVFMGAPAFSVPTLHALVSEGHAVVAVYTRAPKPGGRRGLEVKKTPVHETADSLLIPVYTPRTLRSADAQDAFRAHAAEVGVVIAYGLLLPKEILEAPIFGCVNLHASLLPQWRGAAPVQRAIMAGDSQTGVDLMRMEETLDTGPIGLREVVPILPEDTAGDLAARLSEIAARLAVMGIRELETGTLVFRPQEIAGATYAAKIEKREAEIDWRLDAQAVRNHIHGLSPAPGAYSHILVRNRPQRFKFLRAQAVAASGAPGTIIEADMTIACGRGSIRVVEAQRAGGIVLSGEKLMQRESLPRGVAFAPAHTLSPRSFETL